MNEFTLGIYHFKGTRFPLALSAFTWKTNRVRRGEWGFNFSFNSGIGEWETDERKRSSVSSSKWRAARKSHLRFNVHVQSLFYFASYRRGSATFFARYRQGNNRQARRTRLTSSASFITLVKYVLLSSRRANRRYTLNLIELNFCKMTIMKKQSPKFYDTLDF